MQDQGRSETVRCLPHDQAAEAAVLGSMMLDPRCVGDVIQKLDKKSFYYAEHALIFQAIVNLWEKSESAVDGLLVRKEIESQGWMDQIGGLEYLQKVLDSTPASANAAYYAGIVEDKAMARALIAAATDTLNAAYDPTGELEEKIDQAEQKIFKICERRIKSDSVYMKDLVLAAFEGIENRNGKGVTGLATGFYELDDMTCGFQKGDMIIIAGRPSMGKSAIVLNIAERLGVLDKKPVAIFSLEMGRQQLAERFMCSYAQIDSQLVRKGMLGQDAYEKLVEAANALGQAPIIIDDTSSLTPMELRAKARRLASKENIQCIIVDYLQLMTQGGKVENRQQEITTISRHIKGLARELNIPVIVLSQLNRSPENREDHRPRMSDLRESGSIEQDSDVVMLLHREDYYHRGDAEYVIDNVAEVIVAKQRNGPTGVVRLTFREQCTRFENLALVSETPW